MSTATVPLFSEHWLPQGISSTSRLEYLTYALPAATMDLDALTNETDTCFIPSTSRARLEYLSYVLPAATMGLEGITNETSNRDSGFIPSTSRSHSEYHYLMYALPAAMMDLDALSNESTNCDTGFISYLTSMFAYPVAPYHAVESSNHNADSYHKSLRTRAPGKK